MKTLFFLLLSILAPFLGNAEETAHPLQTPSAEEILSKADLVRNPADSYLLEVAVQQQGMQELHRFRVAIEGPEHTLIETLAPLRERQRNLLMIKENMWAYIPSLKRAVRVPLYQKLTGDAANGDLSRLRWSGDYHPILETEETAAWILLLTAKKQGLAYDKIRVWVQKDTFRPLKAQYLTLAGKALKEVSYDDYKELAGGMRPGRITIQDSLRPADITTITIEKMQVRTFPPSLFHKDTLGTIHIH